MNSLRQCTRCVTGRSPCYIHPSLVSTPSWLRRPTTTISQPRRIFGRTMSSSQSGRPLAPRLFPTSGFKMLNHAKPIEEESLPEYNADIYYPVYIGQVFRDRYQVVGKLGYGVTSTVWLARDLVESNDPGYVVLKICVARHTRGNEIAMYERINSVAADMKHPGHEFIRKALASFEVEGPHGKHTCIVLQALGNTMDHVFPCLINDSVPLDTVKLFFRQLLLGLDFLHTQAGIIHADLQPNNLLLPVSTPAFYKEFEGGEFDGPSSRKTYKDRTIYCSRYMSQSLEDLPLICDFGDARFADQEHDDHLIMQDSSRAPEVVMQMKWNHKVDIWGFAMVAWQFVSPRPLFCGLDPENNEHHDVYLAAEMAAVMGRPSHECMSRSKVFSLFWDENGKWTDLVPFPDVTLEKLAEDIQGSDKDKEGFLCFIRRILRWEPEKRPSAKDLIFDPWMVEDLGLTDEQIKDYQENWLEEEGDEKGEESRSASLVQQEGSSAG